MHRLPPVQAKPYHNIFDCSGAAVITYLCGPHDSNANKEMGLFHQYNIIMHNDIILIK